MNQPEITQKATQLLLQGNANKSITGHALADYQIGKTKCRFTWMDGSETTINTDMAEDFFKTYWPVKEEMITWKEHRKKVALLYLMTQVPFRIFDLEKLKHKWQEAEKK